MFQLNSSPPGQNGRHIADDIFKRILLSENLFSIDNKAALFRVMACRLFGAKPLPESMMT